MLIIYFNNKVLNNFLKNYFQLKINTSIFYTFIFYFNEIIILKERKKLFTEKLNSETKN